MTLGESDVDNVDITSTQSTAKKEYVKVNIPASTIASKDGSRAIRFMTSKLRPNVVPILKTV